MDTNNFIIRGLEAFSNGAPVLCTEVRPTYEYVDGKRTDRRIGTTYLVVFVGNGYKLGDIKTPDITPPFDNTFIESQGGPIPISTVNLRATIYLNRRTGRPEISMKADSIRPISDEPPQPPILY